MPKSKKTIEVTPDEVDAFVDAFSAQFQGSEPENNPEDDDTNESTPSNSTLTITEGQFEVLQDIYDNLDNSIDNLKNIANTSYEGSENFISTSFGFDLGILYAELRATLVKVSELVDAIEESNDSFVYNEGEY
jgi:hypothetical protein